MGGVRMPTDIMCEDVRSISVQRLIRPLAWLPNHVMDEIGDRLRIVLGL
jgi:mRNA-degrading endonuclease toxin of MazEF toxin-antitoxin module